MILNIYSVFDIKSGIYGNPFYTHTQAEAIRLFADAANDPETALSKHPADYRLDKIGVFDNCSAVIEPQLEAIGFAVSYIQPTATKDLFDENSEL